MATSEANLKNPDNKDNNEESPSTSPFKNPKILIGIIVISVIVIVAVVVIAVVLAKMTTHQKVVLLKMIKVMKDG